MQFQKLDLPPYTEISEVQINDKRHYQTPDGVFPSVTTVLSSIHNPALDEWRERVGEEEAARVSGRSASHGTKLHKLCEDYILGEDKSKNAMPTARIAFRSVKPILEENLKGYYGIEVPLWSKYLKTAGRTDLVGQWGPRTRNSIIDFKSSQKPKKIEWITNYFYQTAGYAVMFEERFGIPITDLVIVVAVSHMPPQVFTGKRDDYIKDFIKVRKEYGQNNNISAQISK